MEEIYIFSGVHFFTSLHVKNYETFEEEDDEDDDDDEKRIDEHTI